MNSDIYPYKCDALLKEKLWGGTQLRDFLHKETNSNKIGESWEIASLPEGNSRIANGKHKGKGLNELLSAFAKAILGESIAAQYGSQMPLLIKFIDASKKLSVQLHPDDQLAQDLHKQPQGKTEMWYVLKARKEAHIIAGFKQEMDGDTFQDIIKNGDLEGTLNHIPVKEGDAFFINAGLIHAIGKGIVLAEIQQTSDITYRIFDYNRKQEDGSYRELHIDNACKAIKFLPLDEVVIQYDKQKEGVQVLKHAPFFKTDIVHIKKGEHVIDRNESFTIIIGVKGKGVITCDHQEYRIAQGETYLLPAKCSKVTIKSKELKILEVYM